MNLFLVLSIALTAVVAIAAAPQRLQRSLEPAGYVPPSGNHLANNEYLPPVEEQQSASHGNENGVPQGKANQEYLPPVEEESVAAPEQPEANLQPENADNINQNLPQARQDIAKLNEYLPPDVTTLAPVSGETPLSVRLETDNSQAQAEAEGDQAEVSACVDGQCVENSGSQVNENARSNDQQRDGYFYPKPEQPFSLPARTIEEPLPIEGEAKCEGASESGKVRRDTKKSTYPSQKNEQPHAQTLPAKLPSAQTLPAKVRRDTNEPPKKQTKPAKLPTAQTLPGKIGTAQTQPAKV